MNKNIVLMGYRGTGKTVVAEELGKKLNRKIIDTDKEIEKKVLSANPASRLCKPCKAS